MMDYNNEDKKSYVCGGGGGGDVRVGVPCSLCNFYACRNRTFISSAREGSNVGLEILQLSGGQCTIPS